ncbi:hypothetical protein Tco_0978980 [Tanacetum coccineum]|uniref:Uncharacterized protein n=1 Tax=Tanacetum coccineum TaxID=301880 RepID=A0ABQ5EPW4_9ASTR
MSDKSSPLKCWIIEISVWVKLSEGENVFTLATDSYASNPTPIECMERVSCESLSMVVMETCVKTKCDRCKVSKVVEAKVFSSEVESEEWSRLLLC